MMNFLRCPRCGIRCFERFTHYGSCHDCNYFEVRQSRPIPEERIKRPEESPERDPPYFYKGRSHLFDRFTEEDHRIVRRALLAIPTRAQRAVYLRFWKQQRKSEIAEKLGLSERRVDRILEAALGRLRKLCLKDPEFSRALEPIEKENL